MRAFAGPHRMVVTRDLSNVFGALVDVRRAAEAGRYAIGFVSYGAAPAFDPALVASHTAGFPLVWFAVFDRPPTPINMEVFSEAPRPLLDWQPEISRDAYAAGIARIRKALADGQTYQVNYTQRFHALFDGDPLAYFHRLYEAQPAAYAAYLDTGRFAILCTSPEMFFEMDGEAITTMPMKGTAPRGRWLEEDLVLRDTLQTSEKERAENVMIVDLMRSDLGRIAAIGSVRVPAFFEVTKLPTVWQMTSAVYAELRRGVEMEDIFAAAFPSGSVTGAPKPRTMGIISDLESSPRGVYCGAIGMVCPGNRALFNVAIRTVVIDKQTGEAECGIGGGITWDSTVEGEYGEVMAKSLFLTRREPKFELVETLRLEEGRYVLLDRHLERLRRSATYFDLDHSEDEIVQRLTEAARGLPTGIYRVRMTVSKRGDVTVEANSLIAPDKLVARLAAAPVDESDPFLYHKTTNRGIYDVHRQELAADADVLLWNRRGEVTEFTLGNVVYEKDGYLYTPPRECGLLDGTLRAELLARGTVEIRPLNTAELATCEGLWHINSVRLVTPVSLDGYPNLVARPSPFSMDGRTA